MKTKSSIEKYIIVLSNLFSTIKVQVVEHLWVKGKFQTTAKYQMYRLSKCCYDLNHVNIKSMTP